MLIRISALLLLVFISHSPAALMTGTFQNMDFSTALPAERNYDPFDAARVEGLSWIFGNYIVFNNTAVPGVLEQYLFQSSGGDYALRMYASAASSNEPPATLSQVGEIPDQAKSVQCAYDIYSDQPRLYINDIEVALHETSSGILAGDIEAWAGQSVELEFRVYNRMLPGYPGTVDYVATSIDDIGFSATAIPEPSTVGLLGTASVVLLLSRRKKHSHHTPWPPRRQAD